MSIFYFPKIVFQNGVFVDNIINAPEGYKEGGSEGVLGFPPNPHPLMESFYGQQYPERF